MSEDHGTPEQLPLPQATIRSQEHKIVFADTFSIRATTVDFAMTFSTQSAVPLFNPNTGLSTMVNAIIEQFTVAMPLPTFKALAEHMAKVVQIIESEIGHIRTPTMSQLTPQQEEMIRNNLKNNPLA
jgi:hypothetical protein